jgi:predicted kinase
MLIVLGGPPGTGNMTIGKSLAVKRTAVYVRVDEIENALQSLLPSGQKNAPEGYVIGQAIALSNLKPGLSVVADSVNPVPESRQAWRDLARKAGTGLLEIELICSGLAPHQRRAERGMSDIDNIKLPVGQASGPMDISRGPSSGWYWAPPCSVSTMQLRRQCDCVDDAIANIEARLKTLPRPA